MSERTLKLSQPLFRRPFLQREPDFTMALRRASPLLLPLNQTACQIFVALLPTRRVVGGLIRYLVGPVVSFKDENRAFGEGGLQETKPVHQDLRFRAANMVGRTHLSMVCASGPLRVDSRVTTQYYWLYARICVDHWTNIPSPRHRRPQVDNPQLVNPFSPRIYNLQSRSIKWPLGEPA